MSARERKNWIQLELPPKGRGGRRPGAGRPKKADAGVPHVKRRPQGPRRSFHVTVRLKDHVWNLRSRRAARVLRDALCKGKERFGMRVVHFSVQGNHLHLIVEAHEEKSLTRGMKGLNVRIARGLNKLMGRRGAVVADRFHSRLLATPRQVRNALSYVLNNAHQHHEDAPRFDVYSSAAYFDGWSIPCDFPPSRDPPVVPASLWLLTTGWRMHGLIAPGGRQEHIASVQAR